MQVIGTESISSAHPQHEGTAVTSNLQTEEPHLRLNKEFKETELLIMKAGAWTAILDLYLFILRVKNTHTFAGQTGVHWAGCHHLTHIHIGNLCSGATGGAGEHSTTNPVSAPGTESIE